MIDYNVFRFTAPPRTGSTWFMHAATAAGFGNANLKSQVHVRAPKAKNTLTVSLVRHPVHWLLSYWCELQGGFTGVADVDALMGIARENVCFSSFARDYLKHMPGQVGRIMMGYQADSYIRTEDLSWACYDLFTASGAKAKDALKAVGLPPVNVFPLSKKPLVSPTTRDLIMEAEDSWLSQFDYV